MGMGIQDFYDSVQRNGFHKDYQFRVMQIGEMTENDNPDMFLYCTKFTVPSKTTVETSVHHFGLEYSIPSGVQFEKTLSMEFWMDAKMDFNSIFELSHQDVFEHHSGKSPIQIKNKILQLDLLNDNMSSIFRYKFYGCFLKTRKSMDYGMSDIPSLVKVNVDLTYQWYDTFLVAPLEFEKSFWEKLNNSLRKIKSTVNRINNIRRSVRSLGNTLGIG